MVNSNGLPVILPIMTFVGLKSDRELMGSALRITRPRIVCCNRQPSPAAGALQGSVEAVTITFQLLLFTVLINLYQHYSIYFTYILYFFMYRSPSFCILHSLQMLVKRTSRAAALGSARQASTLGAPSLQELPHLDGILFRAVSCNLKAEPGQPRGHHQL